MTDGARILLVEDDVLIGMMLVDMFDALGLPEPAQAASMDEALAIIAAESLAGALVDINLGEEKGWPVADALAERGIPFAFTSGGGTMDWIRTRAPASSITSIALSGRKRLLM